MFRRGLLLLLAMLLWNSQAFADERYAVEVSVDVTDSSAAVAQQRAMNEAYRAAVVTVARKVTTPEGAAKIAAMTNEQLVNFIKEVSVIEEKRSAVRYMAKLKVVLNEEMLREYMKERDIPVMKNMSHKVLVVPVFREFSSDAPMLWESANLWRQAWDKVGVAGMIKIVPLSSSGFNYAVIDGNKALAMDGEALDKLMRLNGADDVYVLDAIYDGIEGLTVKATSYSGDRKTIKVSGPRSSGMELFDKAVAEVKTELENRIAKQSVAEASMEDVIVVLYNFAQLSDWVMTENTLKEIPIVNNLEVQALGAGKAQFKLVFNGSMEKLIQLLSEKSYRLVEHGSYYSLERY